MTMPVYRGLSKEDLDSLIKAAIDDFDLWGWYGSSEELNGHIERVNKARGEIRKEEID